MANTSIYDDQFLTEDQRRQVQAFKEEWERASAAGDRAGMDAAHAAAERVRAQANYSGGADGADFVDLGKQAAQAERYRGAALPSYRAQTEAVDRTYDAAREATLAALKSAFDANSADIEARARELPGSYQALRNQAAALSEQTGRQFDEYAAASGLSSGAGGQAKLARVNQLQGDLTDLNAQENQARQGLEDQAALLRRQYQNDIASAVAQGEYQRAAALLGEYQRAAQSAVDIAQAQADENYRAWQSGSTVRTQAARSAGERAEELAEFGDFSGYRELGYSQDQVERMRRAWISRNPRLAYDLGAISAGEYYQRTGKWPV